MIIRIVLFLWLAAVAAPSLHAQEHVKRNDFYLELGGNGVLASLNYERQLSKRPGLGLRAGVGVVPMIGTSFPMGVQYLLKTSRPNAFVDVGFGVTYIAGPADKSDKIEKVNYVPSLGYRVHTNNNTMFRVGFTPLFNRAFVFPIIGISFGKRF